jgi:hypothetical protein
MLAPVSVTFVLANARPHKLEPTPVKVMADPASTFPTKSELLSNVAAVPRCQYTFAACPPPAIMTEPPMGVREDSAMKIQTAFAGPLSVNWLVNVPTPLIQ